MAQEFRGSVYFGRTLSAEGAFTNVATIGEEIQLTVAIDGDEADVRVGGSGESGDIRLYSAANMLDPTIHLDGAAGDIKLLGADCAEEFEIVEGCEDVEPGSVMIIDQAGKLQQSATAYDKKVIGVVSGASKLKPGIILGKGRSVGNGLPVALIGRVFCKVDACKAPIEVGDLLTTSNTAGHAMKAEDPEKSFGAVIGKALGTLKNGTGLIPVLVSLQ